MSLAWAFMVLGPFAFTTKGAPFGMRQTMHSAAGANPGREQKPRTIRNAYDE
ncbi:MAG: hypothetical protein NPIRA02_23110 [Nitrospirales bacterium]|nr:MAG: hypothetical protein NPIRA02_23110 [Nitrospirales bacterium]